MIKFTNLCILNQIVESPEESEVSGEYNPFRDDPTNPFQDNHSDPFGDDPTNPFREDPFGKKISAEMLERRIELVETDDCTSLDTTVKLK